MDAYLPDGRLLSLTSKNFIAQGAEGAVYAHGHYAYKLFFDHANVMSALKMSQLQAIAAGEVLTPMQHIYNSDGHAIGYEMEYVQHAQPLCRLIPQVYRDRHGLGPDQIAHLVKRMADVVRLIHRADCLVVDLNEMNILVNQFFDRIYFIDTDSFKTPSFAATAIMDSVRDRHMGPHGFHEGSDWFSFAVVTSQLFMGMHPYRGKHPILTTLDARMNANVSIFEQSVQLPPTAGHPSGIPSMLRGWYEAVFSGRTREPPPTDFGAAQIITPSDVRDGVDLKFTVTDRFPQPLKAFASAFGRSIGVTKDTIYLDGKAVGPAPEGIVGIGFSDRRGHPVVGGWSVNQGLTLWDPVGRTTLAFGMSLDDFMVSNHRFYGLSGGHLIELRLVEVGSRVVVTPDVIARVRPHATHLFTGVAVQRLLDQTYFSVVSAGACESLHIPEVKGHRIVDALYQSRVLWLISHNGSEYFRWIIRFDEHHRRYHVVHEAVPDLFGLDGVVLDSGVVICRESNGALRVFHRDLNIDKQRLITPDDATCHTRFFGRGAALGFVRDSEAGTLRMK